MEYYLSTPRKNSLTFGFRIEGVIGYGNRPYYKMPTLGTNFGLRGCSGNRFTGQSSLFINTELRQQLLFQYTKIVPVKLGVKLFFDTGRVFYNSEKSVTWHYVYGAGLYIIPFEEFLSISFSLAFSNEQSFYPVFGLGTSLR